MKVRKFGARERKGGVGSSGTCRNDIKSKSKHRGKKSKKESSSSGDSSYVRVSSLWFRSKGGSRPGIKKNGQID